MRTLLRNIPTRLYVESPGTWTDKAESALDFGGMRQAIGFAKQEDLRRMELVLVSGRADQWLVVPVSSIGFATRRLLEASKFRVLNQKLAA